MGKKEKKMKNKLFWASAAIASSILFSQLVLGTPVSAADEGTGANAQTSQTSQGQTVSFHDMNEHSNFGNTTVPSANTTAGVRSFSSAQAAGATLQAAPQSNVQAFAAKAQTMMSFTIGDQSVPRTDVVDVASYQGWMNQDSFNTLHSLGVRGAVVKASEGTSYQNPFAASQIQYARNAGMTVSAYHYSHFGSSAEAVAEANFFANTLDKLNVGKEVNVVADVEGSDVSGDVGASLNAFWQTLNQRGYTHHVLYTGKYYTYSNAAIGTVGKNRTWVADYPYTPSANSMWNQDFGAWQYSSLAYLPGASKPVDVSVDYTGLFTQPNAATPPAPSYDPILSNKSVSYDVTIVNQDTRKDGIYFDAPYHTSASTAISNFNGVNYNNQNVHVQAETVTSRSTYLQVKAQDGKVFWIDKNGTAQFSFDSIVSQQTVDYPATIQQQGRGDGIYTAGPYHTSAATSGGNSDATKYDGQKVQVIAEATTSRAGGTTYAQVRLADGQTFWIDKRGLQTGDNSGYDKILLKKSVSYLAIVDQSHRADGLYANGPYHTSAITAIGNDNAKSLNGQLVQVLTEATTSRSTHSTYVQIRLANGQTYWTDKLALTSFSSLSPILSTNNVNYDATINQKDRVDGLYSDGPYHTSISTLVGNDNAKQYDGQKVHASVEQKTDRGTYVKVQFTDGHVYWIDKGGLTVK
ncbi:MULTISPECIES: GW dipeptide domain-containing protein [Lacticaseibacillus]|uniref:Lysozyme n=2 Tax=Lacticaseibacillus TaxID=2759736 RepID=A0AAD1ARF2_LACCA|nr:GW dipeptide domain-containing protein [Lacticaseibacillus casei]MBI6597572.1 SH3-like domain-containing protein [Lacticaseibacillus casei]MBO1481225.1 SH3-like domain-containing protein [Lacticaseibacillus casei]MBO2416466.1 SH3-like domain-containing protein [Lacticaseibacillus casei]MCK2080951.1 SH3-like domain-containing protein [Lacticaseibacillus casei]MDZ5495431.1 GW dipeptide domain-containing protein [Lacticaseibacillus casei]